MRRLCAAVCIMATSGSVLSVWGGTYAEEFIGNRQGGEYPRTPGGCEDPAWCDSAGFLCEFDTLYRADGTPMSVVSARAHKGMAVVRFAGIDTPEQAEALRNTVLYMNRADVELDADTYFIRDLIGLQVLDADTGAVYGRLEEVLETGANDVYTIRTPEGKQLLFPAIGDVVVETDLEQGIMRIRPLEGLFDDAD